MQQLLKNNLNSGITFSSDCALKFTYNARPDLQVIYVHSKTIVNTVHNNQFRWVDNIYVLFENCAQRTLLVGKLPENSSSIFYQIQKGRTKLIFRWFTDNETRCWEKLNPGRWQLKIARALQEIKMQKLKRSTGMWGLEARTNQLDCCLGHIVQYCRLRTKYTKLILFLKSLY